MAGPPDFDWNKLFSKESQPKWVIGVVAVVAFIGFASLLKTGPNFSSLPSLLPSNTHADTGGGAPGQPVGGSDARGSGPVPLNTVTERQCATFAPDGWTFTDVDDRSSTATLMSADHAMIASYGGLAINGGQAVGAYGPQFTTPENAIQFVIQALTGSPAQIAPQQTFGSYQVATIQSGAYGGYALYYRFGIPADPAGYGLIMRVALATGGPKAIATAGSVAAALRCQTQFQPHDWGVDRGTGNGTGTSSKCVVDGNCDDADLAGTYNAQLGTGWAHDPNTGRLYNVDVTSDWTNGPEGEGYYGPSGNGVVKLVPGLE